MYVLKRFLFYVFSIYTFITWVLLMWGERALLQFYNVRVNTVRFLRAIIKMIALKRPN